MHTDENQNETAEERQMPVLNHVLTQTGSSKSAHNL